MPTSLPRGAPSRRPALPAVCPNGDVWYFAYGSNMNPKTLQDRRRVFPCESHPARLPGWVLSFRVVGLPYAEPAFATVERAGPHTPAPDTISGSTPRDSRWRREVHGVLHRLRLSDWQQVMATEGVGGSAGREEGYHVVEVECQAYDGRAVRALTLEARGSSLHPDSRAATPSARYVGLLRDGARHYGLDPDYVSYLDSIRPYDSSRTVAAVGKAAAMAFALPLALPLLPPVLLLRAASKQAEENGSNNSNGTSARRTPGSGVGGAMSDAAGAAKTTAGLASDIASARSAAAVVPPSLQPGASDAQAAAAAAGYAGGGAGDTSTAGSGTYDEGRLGGSGRLPEQVTRPPLVLPDPVSYYLTGVRSAVWTLHDYVAAPLLGSGCSNRD